MKGERGLVEWLRTNAPRVAGSGVVLGIGDDCAIYRPRAAGEELVFTTDLLVEDVHFRREYAAAAVGHRALARGLSDIAAMGAAPRFCLLSVALAGWSDEKWLKQFFRGLFRLAGREKVQLAGGDLGRAERVACDIVVCGAVPRGQALRRDTARAGDRLYVSGPLGGAALGLESGKGNAAAWKKHLLPEPRLALGRALRKRATAAMDLSDGLSMDLARLCEASGVAARLHEELPVFPGATMEQALHGGEDYELLFAMPAGRRAPKGCRWIGELTAGARGSVYFRGRRLAALGYDHLK